MVQLHGDFRAFAMDSISQIAQTTNEPVVVNSDWMPDRTSHLPIDRSVLGNDKSNSATGAGPMVLDQLIVNLAKGAGELGKNRRLYEAISQLHAANPTRLE
jgi:hypothetical protein